MSHRTGKSIMDILYGGGTPTDDTQDDAQEGQTSGGADVLARHSKVFNLERALNRSIVRIASLELENKAIKGQVGLLMGKVTNAERMANNYQISSVGNNLNSNPMLSKYLGRPPPSECSEDSVAGSHTSYAWGHSIGTWSECNASVLSSSDSSTHTGRKLVSDQSCNDCNSEGDSDHSLESSNPHTSKTPSKGQVLCRNKYVLFGLVLSALLQYVQCDIEQRHSCSYPQSVSRGLGRLGEVIRVVCTHKGYQLPGLKDKAMTYLNQSFARQDKNQVPYVTTETIETIFRLPVMDDFVRHLRVVVAAIKPYSSFLIHPTGYILDNLDKRVVDSKGKLAIDLSKLKIVPSTSVAVKRYKMSQSKALELLKEKIAADEKNQATKRKQPPISVSTRGLAMGISSTGPVLV